MHGIILQYDTMEVTRLYQKMGCKRYYIIEFDIILVIVLMLYKQMGRIINKRLCKQSYLNV
jgi:hypothetical protein